MPLALHRHHQHQQHSIHDLLQPHQHPKEAAAAAPTTKEANSKLPVRPGGLGDYCAVECCVLYQPKERLL